MLSHFFIRAAAPFDMSSSFTPDTRFMIFLPLLSFFFAVVVFGSSLLACLYKLYSPSSLSRCGLCSLHSFPLVVWMGGAVVGDRHSLANFFRLTSSCLCTPGQLKVHALLLGLARSVARGAPNGQSVVWRLCTWTTTPSILNRKGLYRKASHRYNRSWAMPPTLLDPITLDHLKHLLYLIPFHQKSPSPMTDEDPSPVPADPRLRYRDAVASISASTSSSKILPEEAEHFHETSVTSMS